MIRITTPLTKDKLKALKAGDQVLISGHVYTSRDAGHARMIGQLDRGESLPFEIKDSIIYYVGPSPAKPGAVIGSAGPTTSYRMDPFAPRLLEEGMSGMIGKGNRSDEVINAMKKKWRRLLCSSGWCSSLNCRSNSGCTSIGIRGLRI